MNIQYKINITSTTENTLTKEQLDEIFNCYFSDKYQKFKTENIKSIDNAITNVEKTNGADYANTLSWQFAKSREIEDLWHNNINWSIDNNIVKVSISFEVEFPIHFTEQTIIEWVEGFDRLNKVLLTYQLKKIVENNKIVIDKEENNFLERLNNNIKFEIKRCKD